MLKLINVHTYYDDSYVLQGVSLEVKQGSVVALLGRNGMGKTTTLHSIIGFTPPRRGSIIFKGQDLTALKAHQIPQMGLALVPQGKRIFPSLSTKENLTVAQRSGKKLDDWSLNKVNSLFPVLQKRSDIKGTLLSGGEQQMLSIGRALMTNPDLLLLDEPSEGLAPIIVKELGQTITKVRERGLSILLVEQNMHLALMVADYIYIMSRGIIVYESDPQELRENYEVKLKYLGVSV
ncbi:ABC transporter ATP-binding protein [Chloroflexota bacterium]